MRCSENQSNRAKAPAISGGHNEVFSRNGPLRKPIAHLHAKLKNIFSGLIKRDMQGVGFLKRFQNSICDSFSEKKGKLQQTL